jgi:hypothetical protein
VASVIKKDGRLVLDLTNLEKLGAFHGNPSIEESALVRKYEIENVWNAHDLRGIRAPGTGIPFVIMLGTLRYRGGKDFCAIYKRQPVTIYEFNSGPYKRWIVTNSKESKAIEAN